MKYWHCLFLRQRILSTSLANARTPAEDVLSNQFTKSAVIPEQPKINSTKNLHPQPVKIKMKKKKKKRERLT